MSHGAPPLPPGAGWQFERNLTESITGNIADKGVRVGTAD